MTKYSSDYLKFTYAHTMNHWIMAYLNEEGEDKVDWDSMAYEIEAKRNYKNKDKYKAKILVHWNEKDATIENKKFVI